MKIKSIKREFKNYQMHLTGVMENGTEERVFAYYDDEISFTDDELIGKTIEEAREFRTRRDIAYLQS